MTGRPLTVDAFGDQPLEHGSALDHAAQQLTAAYSATTPDGLLVLALHPNRPNRRVVASAGNSAIRAAVSVAVAAGNTRAWSDAKHEAVVEVDIQTLPEIIRAAVVPAAIAHVRVGCVKGDLGADCLVMWLSERDDDVEGDDARAALLQQLSEAAAIDRQQAALAAERAAAVRSVAVAPDLDPLARLLDNDQLEDALADMSSDETGLVVFSIDDVDRLADAHGADGVETIAGEIATRLARTSRKTDLLARLAIGTFAVVLVAVDRRTAFEVSKRIRSTVVEPIELATGTVELAISVGLAHEVGLVDPIELFESSAAAMREAAATGGARMVVAS